MGNDKGTAWSTMSGFVLTFLFVLAKQTCTQTIVYLCMKTCWDRFLTCLLKCVFTNCTGCGAQPSNSRFVHSVISTSESTRGVNGKGKSTFGHSNKFGPFEFIAPLAIWRKWSYIMEPLNCKIGTLGIWTSLHCIFRYICIILDLYFCFWTFLTLGYFEFLDSCYL